MKPIDPVTFERSYRNMRILNNWLLFSLDQQICIYNIPTIIVTILTNSN